MEAQRLQAARVGRQRRGDAVHLERIARRRAVDRADVRTDGEEVLARLHGGGGVLTGARLVVPPQSGDIPVLVRQPVSRVDQPRDTRVVLEGVLADHVAHQVVHGVRPVRELLAGVLVVAAAEDPLGALVVVGEHRVDGDGDGLLHGVGLAGNEGRGDHGGQNGLLAEHGFLGPFTFHYWLV